jgi:ATP-dependent helicase/nuclease subunit A
MSIEPGRPGVVRLMTLHGAKGLEAPVVILADPTGDGHQGRDYWIDRERNPPAGHFRIAHRMGQWGELDIALPQGWARMCTIEEEFEAAERIRLLYVGATRAAEMLVVSVKRTASGKAGGPWAALDPFLAAGLALPAPFPVRAPSPPVSLPESIESLRARRAARVASSSRASYSVTPVTGIAHTGPKPAWERTGRGMSWGRVLHGILEALMRDPGLDVRTYAANLLADEERPENDLEEVVRVVEGVRASELWQRALSAKTRLVEVPFAVLADRAEVGLLDGPAKTLLQGAIDLVFEEEDGWTLIDYKSDTVTSNLEDLVRYYTPQVARYRRYWETLTGRPTRAGLFFLHSGATEWVDA